MRLKVTRVVMLALLAALSSPQAFADASAKLLYGFEKEMLEKEMGKAFVSRIKEQEDGSLFFVHDVTLRFFKKNATQGEWATAYRVTKGRWNLLPNYAKGIFPDLTARPPVNDYHDPADWFYQRMCQIIDDALAHRLDKSPRDWSGYNFLRFDGFSEGTSAVLGMRVHDRSGPVIRARPLGLRTAVAVFKLPANKLVTCEFPLAEMARVAEMDLSKVQGFNLRVNGYQGEALVYIDKIRLVRRSAAQQDAGLPLVKMEGKPGPFARKVVYRPPVKKNKEAMKRDVGPVGKLGPVTVLEAPGGYACGFGHFGGSGATYFQNSIRGVVAYDNDRLLVAMKAALPSDKVLASTRDVCEGGGIVALASFDGGKTWGGLTPDEKLPLHLGNWYWRAFACSDKFGNLYHIGTENCCSYHEGYDVYVRRLAFTGGGWQEDRFTVADQNLQKCPSVSRVLALDTGRIWAAWTDGWGGCVAKYSDDDGFTWVPCKDASISKLPRPFYQRKLAELGTPDAPKPPSEVLLWPGTPVTGPLLVPYKGQVAVTSSDGSAWQAHDGRKWVPVNKGPFSKTKGPGHIMVSETVLGKDKLFLARSSGYDNSARSEYLAPLVAAYLEGEGWKVETLEAEGIADSILTSSGDRVYCFYVKKVVAGDEVKYEVRYRRWNAGEWEPSELVATEHQRINRLAAPQSCPPSYACIFWDQWSRNANKETTWVRFAWVPNK